MGLFYPKQFEGSIYYNGTGTRPSPGDAIAPGDCFVYKWWALILYIAQIVYFANPFQACSNWLRPRPWK
jgi:hypothetical protein